MRARVRLPRTVWLIGAISLVNDAASDMLYPLLPLYLASVLMAGPRALGIIEGVAEATAALLKLVSGALYDRVRRAKPWLVGGYGLAAVTRPLIAFVTAWPWLAALRFADRVGKGLRSSPRDALLAASVDPGSRGLAFGLHRAMDNTGAVIGPLVAAALLTAGVGLREVFVWAALPGALTVALALALREPPALPSAATLRPDWRWQGLPPAFRRYLVVVALFTLGNASNMFLLLRARDLGASDAGIPLLWAAVSAVAAIFSTPLSALSDRWGRTRLLVAGWLAYAAFYAAMGLAGDDVGPLGLGLAFGFYGLFLAATEGVEKALVADLAPADRRGTAFGWFHLVTGVTLLPASLLFGTLYEGISAGAAFAVAAACAALAAGLLAGWVRVPRAAI